MLRSLPLLLLLLSRAATLPVSVAPHLDAPPSNSQDDDACSGTAVPLELKVAKALALRGLVPAGDTPFRFCLVTESQEGTDWGLDKKGGSCKCNGAFEFVHSFSATAAECEAADALVYYGRQITHYRKGERNNNGRPEMQISPTGVKCLAKGACPGKVKILVTFESGMVDRWQFEPGESPAPLVEPRMSNFHLVLSFDPRVDETREPASWDFLKVHLDGLQGLYPGPWLTKDLFTRPTPPWASRLAAPYAPISWIARDDFFRAAKRREAYFQDLGRHMPVDSLGKVWPHGQAFPAAVKGNHTQEVAHMCRYKFMFVAENYLCDGYITEKFWRPFICGTVPVIWGMRSHLAWAPATDSYIYAGDFDSPAALAAKLVALAADPVAYAKFFDWKKRPFAALNPAFQKLYLHMNAPQAEPDHWCRLVHRARRMRASGIFPPAAPLQSCAADFPPKADLIKLDAEDLFPDTGSTNYR